MSREASKKRGKPRRGRAKGPASARADALLHPLRLRIVEAVAAHGGPMTPAMLQAALTDVPPATLYRHLGALEQAGVLAVVGEAPKRGAIERTYALREQAAELDAAAARALSVEEHLRGFSAFTAHLMSAWGRYLRGAGRAGKVDLAADGAGYRAAVLHLSDAEFAEMVAALQAALAPFVGRPAAEGRRARLLATTLFPFCP